MLKIRILFGLLLNTLYISTIFDVQIELGKVMINANKNYDYILWKKISDIYLKYIYILY